jgi:hypothetical protein
MRDGLVNGVEDAPAVSEDDELMALPAALVVEIDERAVVIRLPGERGGLRLKRGVYNVFRAFHLPKQVAEVLPDDPAKRAKVMDVVRLLAAKGFLVPPEVGIPILSGTPTTPWEPDAFSARA